MVHAAPVGVGDERSFCPRRGWEETPPLKHQEKDAWCWVPGAGESQKAEDLRGREREYPVGWKGSTPEVRGVSQVVEDSDGVRGPGLAF